MRRQAGVNPRMPDIWTGTNYRNEFHIALFQHGDEKIRCDKLKDFLVSPLKNKIAHTVPSLLIDNNFIVLFLHCKVCLRKCARGGGGE